jgi:anti-sigma B factor antagonist
VSMPVEVAVAEGLAAVAPRGEVDIHTAPELRSALTGVLDDGAFHVVVDLGQVTFMDSSGLSVLVGAHRRLARDGGRLELVGTLPAVERVLRLTGLVDVLDVRP